MLSNKLSVIFKLFSMDSKDFPSWAVGVVGRGGGGDKGEDF